ncbi:DNA-binding transcriptional regulator YiaG [Streptacidiphilus sp. MAP12-16]|uniref:helix-turn-helix domain-containing protein n=1 Tax=Streptacidiphilus sp. MAP12-16 TaxID=3156300 RepID=UPI003511CFF4
MAIRKLTASQPELARVREGVITGYLFKIIRESIPRTQDELAEDLGVDKSTVQGWESGRRPLPATKAGNLIAIRRRLLRLGASANLVQLMHTSMDADFILGVLLAEPTTGRLAGDHPLAGWVLNRDTTHMLAWAMSGILPGSVAANTDTPSARRGPVAVAPLLGQPEREQVFASLRHAAELAERAGDDGALLRRQARYLCGYDRTPDATTWLARAQRPRKAPAGWSPQWAEDRSLAASLARRGDPEQLLDFIARSLGDDASEAANLNYWAHWVGVDTRPQSDDSFMARQTPGWDAAALLRNFTDRLARAFEYTDLYAHSVWALLSARPGLLSADRALACDLAASVGQLLDGDAISPQSRRELQAVHYGLRLSGVSTDRP